MRHAENARSLKCLEYWESRNSGVIEVCVVDVPFVRQAKPPAPPLSTGPTRCRISGPTTAPARSMIPNDPIRHVTTMDSCSTRCSWHRHLLLDMDPSTPACRVAPVTRFSPTHRNTERRACRTQDVCTPKPGTPFHSSSPSASPSQIASSSLSSSVGSTNSANRSWRCVAKSSW